VNVVLLCQRMKQSESEVPGRTSDRRRFPVWHSCQNTASRIQTPFRSLPTAQQSIWSHFGSLDRVLRAFPDLEPIIPSEAKVAAILVR